jgi:hypothetical protein
MAQQNAQIPGFPDPVGGRSKLQIVDHTGPLLYVPGGETFPQQNVYGGPNSLGLAGILYCSSGFTEDGLYWVIPVFGGGGKVRGTITLKWFVAATHVEAGSIALNGSVIRLLVIGG